MTQPNTEIKAGMMEEILRKVLTDHWLAAMICDHENETDKAICSCSRVNLPIMKSVAESAKTWVDHVVDEFHKIASIQPSDDVVSVPTAVSLTDTEVEKIAEWLGWDNLNNIRFVYEHMVNAAMEIVEDRAAIAAMEGGKA
jgi:hypothetical protein